MFPSPKQLLVFCTIFMVALAVVTLKCDCGAMRERMQENRQRRQQNREERKDHRRGIERDKEGQIISDDSQEKKKRRFRWRRRTSSEVVDPIALVNTRVDELSNEFENNKQDQIDYRKHVNQKMEEFANNLREKREAAKAPVAPKAEPKTPEVQPPAKSTNKIDRACVVYYRAPFT